MPDEIHHRDAEQALLGSVLLKDVIYYSINNDISAYDFFDERHRAIWKAIEGIAATSRGSFNAAIVQQFLNADPKSVKIAPDYLDNLIDAVADPNDAERYVEIIVDYARRRNAIRALQLGIVDLGAPDPKRPVSDVVDHINSEMLAAARSDSRSIRTLGDWAEASYRRVEDHVEGRRRVDAYDYPLTALTNTCGPAMPGDLITLAGRSGWGKSALATQIAEHWARRSPGIIFQLEMTGEGVADRALAQHARIPAWRITEGSLIPDDLDKLAIAMRELRELPHKVYLDVRSRLTKNQIRSRLIGARRRDGIGWAIIDTAHAVELNQKARDENAALVDYNADMKAVAKDLGIVLLQLAQVNKAGRERKSDRPRAGDIAHYNAFERASDTIMFVYREEVGVAEMQPSDLDEDAYQSWRERLAAVKGRAEIINAKARARQAMKSQGCMFNGDLIRFYDSQVKADKYQPELTDDF